MNIKFDLKYYNIKLNIKFSKFWKIKTLYFNLYFQIVLD